MESRLLDCEGGVYALLFICVSEIHRLMAAKGAAVDDKGLLQDAEVLPFLQRTAADPTVLCDRRGWRQCYTSTGRLNEAMHGVGNTQGGVDAADKKLTTTFWQQTTEAWSKQASRLATDEMFFVVGEDRGGGV
jgi:hypothetical protein